MTSSSNFAAPVRTRKIIGRLSEGRIDRAENRARLTLDSKRDSATSSYSVARLRKAESRRTFRIKVPSAVAARSAELKRATLNEARPTLEENGIGTAQIETVRQRSAFDILRAHPTSRTRDSAPCRRAEMAALCPETAPNRIGGRCARRAKDILGSDPLICSPAARVLPRKAKRQGRVEAGRAASRCKTRGAEFADVLAEAIGNAVENACSDWLRKALDEGAIPRRLRDLSRVSRCDHVDKGDSLSFSCPRVISCLAVKRCNSDGREALSEPLASRNEERFWQLSDRRSNTARKRRHKWGVARALTKAKTRDKGAPARLEGIKFRPATPCSGPAFGRVYTQAARAAPAMIDEFCGSQATRAVNGFAADIDRVNEETPQQAQAPQIRMAVGDVGSFFNEASMSTALEAAQDMARWEREAGYAFCAAPTIPTPRLHRGSSEMRGFAEARHDRLFRAGLYKASPRHKVYRVTTLERVVRVAL